MHRKIIIWLILMLVVFQWRLYAQEIEYTKRLKNEVREGPGNYFPLVYILPEGIPLRIVTKSKGWIQFETDRKKFEEEIQKEMEKLETWISRNCVIAQKPKKSWKEMDMDWQSIKASPASVAAAIRGFALRYGKASQRTLDSLFQLRHNLFTPQEYFQFRDETKKLLPSPTNESLMTDFPYYFKDYEITLDEEGIGLGIASRLAAYGLVEDRETVKYLNLLTTFLSEVSGAYDIPFRCLIIDDDDFKAFSVPGGYIFNTKGMIDLCEDESELAGIIAHEMMHVILQHGVREIRSRPVHRKMDIAMRELERETGVQPDSVELALEEFALEAYENVMSPRIQGYEEEADRGAVLLLARAGYDPMAVPRMVLRIRDAVKKEPELEMEHPFAYLDFQQRYIRIMEFIKKTVPNTRGGTNLMRFQQYMKD